MFEERPAERDLRGTAFEAEGQRADCTDVGPVAHFWYSLSLNWDSLIILYLVQNIALIGITSGCGAVAEWHSGSCHGYVLCRYDVLFWHQNSN